MHVLRHAYDTYLRGHLPVPPKAGAVHLQDPYLTSARLIRSHFGTHGSVDHGPLPPETDLSALVARQQERFEAHTEPARWPVHAHDPPALAPASGPHRRSLVEHESDGTTFEHRTLALVHRAQVRAASWAVLRTGTPFVVLEGMTAPRPTFLWEWAHRAGTVRPKSGWWVWDQAQARLMAAEVDPQAQPDLHEMLLDSGFHEITTVRTHTWEPSGAPATSRPVTELFDGPEHDDIWDRFTSRFFFAPSTTLFPGIVEPAASVTWPLHRADEDPEHRTELDRTVRQGLAASVPEGESLYTLDWQHIGHRYDPRRVGGPEQPRNPAFAFPNGDYYINLTKDLRLGTFGHPWEEGPHGQGTLCVFGTELLARVEDRLTRLLGPPIRRSGRPVR
ncbi:MAG: DUF2716 domain-containing protein [Nocardiopsis sp. BM-2018]|nr:MAG: DUF2716 domain-containing protein [Nocardiopsis sp. BM-2018]